MEAVREQCRQPRARKILGQRNLSRDRSCSCMSSRNRTGRKGSNLVVRLVKEGTRLAKTRVSEGVRTRVYYTGASTSASTSAPLHAPTCANATTCHLETRCKAGTRAGARGEAGNGSIEGARKREQSGALEKRLSAVKNAGTSSFA